MALYRSVAALVVYLEAFGAIPVPAWLGFYEPVAFGETADAPEGLDQVIDFARIGKTPVPNLAELKSVIGSRKSGTAYPEIPSVMELHLPDHKPHKVAYEANLSPGLADSIIEEAREAQAFDDYKPLSDVRRKPLTPADVKALVAKSVRAAKLAAGREKNPEQAKLVARRKYLATYIDGAYTFGTELEPVHGMALPHWKIESGKADWDAAFAYTEKTLDQLIRRTPAHSDGSLLPNPYPFAIPAGRFQEAYYWDTYFGMLGMLKTGRIELAQMQVDNFLESVRKYGFVPNGMRDYYLTRSQPPFLTSMVRETYDASLVSHPNETAHIKNWLVKRAYPLMKKDYEDFWMNPATRYDAKSALNHHNDDLNLPRPERHAFDDDTTLGKTFRDVRAAAESGLDFTEAQEHETTRIAGPLLNGMLYKTELDLAWAARAAGKDDEAARFEKAAAKRKAAMDSLLWDPVRKRYENYNLRSGKRVDVAIADTAVPLFVGAASPEQAEGSRQALLSLERRGGLASTELSTSTDQWDGDNGWAPFQVMAIQGLKHYGFDDDAKRIAKKWVDMIADAHAKTQFMYERMDVGTFSKPHVDETKYPPQSGFLWTNSSFVWCLTEVLGQKLRAI